MGRSHRRRADAARTDSARDDSFMKFLAGFPQAQTRRGSQWTVQTMATGQSQKPYTCPGCGRTIAVGDAHVVAWRADGVLGDAADLAARRHWHTHCWEVS